MKADMPGSTRSETASPTNVPVAVDGDGALSMDVGGLVGEAHGAIGVGAGALDVVQKDVLGLDAALRIETSALWRSGTKTSPRGRSGTARRPGAGHERLEVPLEGVRGHHRLIGSPSAIRAFASAPARRAVTSGGLQRALSFAFFFSAEAPRPSRQRLFEVGETH